MVVAVAFEVTVMNQDIEGFRDSPVYILHDCSVLQRRALAVNMPCVAASARISMASE